MRFLTLISLFSLLAGGLLGQPIAPRAWTPLHANPLETQLRLVKTGNSISWPVPGRQVVFRISDQMAVWDELPIRYLRFAGADQPIQLPFASMESWVPVEERSGRYTYELQHKFDARARFGLTAVRRSSFLSSLDSGIWNAYLGSLGGLPNPRLITSDDSQSNTQMILVLGGRTRVLEYRHDGEEEGDPVRSVVQIFVDTGSGPIIIFGLECDSFAMPEVGPDFENLVTSFEIIEQP